jgi:hypothetical protein
MDEPTRRNLFGLAAGGGLAALLTSSQSASAADPVLASELFVMKLFTLGDVVRDHRKGGKLDLGAPHKAGTAPDDKDLYAELDQCPLYLIDCRDLSDPKEPKFATAGEFPRLVAGGPLRFEWSGKKGKCVIQVAKLTAALNRTDHRTGTPFRELHPAVELVTVGETDWVRRTTTVGMTPDEVKYDLTGKLLEG